MLASSSLVASGIAAITVMWREGHVVKVVVYVTDRKYRGFGKEDFRKHK